VGDGTGRVELAVEAAWISPASTAGCPSLAVWAQQPTRLRYWRLISSWSGRAHLAGCRTGPVLASSRRNLERQVEPYIDYLDRYIEQVETYSAGPDPDLTAYYSGRD
jgi:hypothetical protein